jgi:hypothetical protein
MAGTLRNMLVRVGADITGLRQGLNQAQKQVGFFGRNVTGSLKEIGGKVSGLMAGLGGGFLVASATKDAMRYESLMTTLGESMGESRKEFEKWQETAGNAFGYSRLQGADTANLLSLNFKQIATDQADLVGKTTKMMEIAAVVANKRGMTMQEVSDRIRSAMNQEADGADELGVNVRVAAVKQSQAYMEMANGTPWDQLSENMRKTILYHHILQQVSERLGSTMQDTTAARMASFTASLADVKMALGQAFLPIMYRVLPLLNTMAQALYKALQVVAAFSRSLFGGGFVYKAPKGFADVVKKDAAAIGGVGDASEEAGKKSKKAADKAKKAWTGLFGFDEVNTIKEPEESAAGAGAGGGGGGGGGGLGGLGEDLPQEPFKPFEQAIDELAKKMDKFTKPIKDAFKLVFGFISGFAKEEFAKVSKWWDENGAKIIQGAKNVWGFIGPIVMAVLKFIWDSVKMVIDGVITTFMGIIDFFTGIFTGDWKLAWEGLKEIFFGALEALMGFWNLSFIGGIKKLLFEFLEAGIKKIITFADDFAKFFKGGTLKVTEFFKAMADGIKTRIHDAKEFIAGRVALMETSFANFWNGIKKAGEGAVNALKAVWGGVKDWFMRTLINPLIAEFDGISKAFSKGPVEGIKYLINKLIDGFNDALNVFNRLKNKTPFADKIPNLSLPHLAKGGITNRPTLAVVGDNRGGQEVISPLDKLQGMMMNSITQALQMGGALGGGSRQSGDVVLNIDGRTFARIVKPFLQSEENRVGTDVRIRTI